MDERRPHQVSLTVISTPPAAPSATPGAELASAAPVGRFPIPPVPPIPRVLVRNYGNLFDGSRAGRAVVRPDDLVALRIEPVNLEVQPGTPPRLVAKPTGDACLVLHFPPQSIAEEVFFGKSTLDVVETPSDLAPYDKVPRPVPLNDANGPVTPPVRARAAGESRLVFACPPGFECDYTLAGVLDAIQSLTLLVPACALPPGAAVPSLWLRLPQTGGVLADVGQRLGKDVARVLATLNVRQRQLLARRDAAARAVFDRRLLEIVGRQVDADELVLHLPQPPRPAAPAALETAIELPWRLLLSPHTGERWRHASRAVTSAATEHTELWHTRLVDPAGNEATVRAVWATTDPSLPQGSAPMQSTFPTGAQLPGPDAGMPFGGAATTLSDRDRYQISHLSANFAGTKYAPSPIDARLLMLSALGGWLDSRAEWEPPGLDLEAWTHRATLGRDHYVRVVYRGVLFPFGHRAALIKTSERRFDHSGEGNPAYLFQRFTLIVRERERSYADTQTLVTKDDLRVRNEFPFLRVRILTRVTPNLVAPTESASIGTPAQFRFWPMLASGNPFRFRIAATDLDGRECEFELPLIFISNSQAAPRTEKNHPDFVAAARSLSSALAGTNGWNSHSPLPGADAPDSESDPRSWTTARLHRQRVTLALADSGQDTSVNVETMTFGAWTPDPDATSANASEPSAVDPNAPGVETPAQEKRRQAGALAACSQNLAQPMFFPRVTQARVAIPAIAQLAGGDGLNTIEWNPVYSRHGFDPGRNKGELFVDVRSGPRSAALDFSKQSDRSGGFVMPNLAPSALSRLLGPVAGDREKLLDGEFAPEEFFPTSAGTSPMPLPLLFGCIPLGAVITGVGDFRKEIAKAPRFVSQALSALDTFFSTISRLYAEVTALAGGPTSLLKAALGQLDATLGDLKAQADAFAPAQAGAVAAAVGDVRAVITRIQVSLATPEDRSFLDGDPLAGIDLTDLFGNPPAASPLRQAFAALRNTLDADPAFPAGFRQSAAAVVGAANTLLDGIATLRDVYARGFALFTALRGLFDGDTDATSLTNLLDDPDALGKKLAAIAKPLDQIASAIRACPFLGGPSTKALLSAIDTVANVLPRVADIQQWIRDLLNEELVIRFDWRPELKAWPDGDAPIFVPHDTHGFVVSVEARAKRAGGTPKLTVHSGLQHFDLVLVAPASFLELNFEKIEFTLDSDAKTSVDVVLNDIKFVGPLSFVETLRDLIPLDGFSDPPYLDVTSQGIEAGFSASLPSIACGVLNISNLSLGARFTVPFIGQPLSVGFHFCTREQPFHLTVWAFGGGGFFGITLDPSGIQMLEAAFEFGAAVAMDFGVASGGVSVMAGIYFRMEGNRCALTGYFRLEGYVSVLGLVGASLELYLALAYESSSGKCTGSAKLTLAVSIGPFRESVTIECERKLAGSNGDPALRQLMGVSADPHLSLADESARIDAGAAYGWRDYCDAFASEVP